MKTLRIAFIVIFYCMTTQIFAQKISETPNDKEYIENELLILLEENIEFSQVFQNALPVEIVVTSKEKLNQHTNIWLANFYYDDFLATENNRDSVRQYCLSLIKQLPGVVMVQNNNTGIKLNTILEPNDPSYADQWNLKHVKFPEAWFKYGTGGLTKADDEIVVAVIDGAYSFLPSDLSLNYWINTDEIAGNGIDDDLNGYVDDINGWNATANNGTFISDPDNQHGTEVSSIIASRGNNSQDISGTNWNVKLMPIHMSFGVPGGVTGATITRAYLYARDMRKLYNETNGEKGAYVVVTNSSWSAPKSWASASPWWCNLYELMADVGIISVSAVDNRDDETGLTYNIDVEGGMPETCGSEFLISTANSNSSNSVVSCYGPNTIDLAAPGVNVPALKQMGSSVGIKTVTGSSYAAPLISGTVALMYSVACIDLITLSKSNPRLAARLFKEALLDGTDRPSGLCPSVKDCRLLNALGAIDRLERSPTSVLNLSGTESGTIIEWAGRINVSPTSSTYLVLPSANVKLFANEWIDFLPGFDTESGSNLDAEVQIFGAKCADETGMARIGLSMNQDEQSLFHNSNNKHSNVLTEARVYPSPFSEAFSLTFIIAADARVTVELCNAMGQTIRPMLPAVIPSILTGGA
jgi:hypothetical protein